MTIIPELDYKRTRANARKVLKDWRSLQRKSGVTVHLQSPVLTDMPGNRSNRNNVEHLLINKIQNVSKRCIEESKKSREKAYAIKIALDSLSDVSYDILYYSYGIANPYSTIKLSNTIKVYHEGEMGKIEEITYSIKNIEKLKSTALIEFAEAYHFDNLLVYKK